MLRHIRHKDDLGVNTINQLIDEVNAARNIHVSGGMHLKKGKNGIMLSGGGMSVAGGGETAAVVWFNLTGVSSSPMTGMRQVYSEGAWGNMPDAEPVDIYPHPSSGIEYYRSGIIAARLSGGRWFAVNTTNIMPLMCAGEEEESGSS